jgi:hypothetical protein
MYKKLISIDLAIILFVTVVYILGYNCINYENHQSIFF